MSRVRIKEVYQNLLTVLFLFISFFSCLLNVNKINSWRFLLFCFVKEITATRSIHACSWGLFLDRYAFLFMTIRINFDFFFFSSSQKEKIIPSSLWSRRHKTMDDKMKRWQFYVNDHQIKIETNFFNFLNLRRRRAKERNFLHLTIVVVSFGISTVLFVLW